MEIRVCQRAEAEKKLLTNSASFPEVTVTIKIKIKVVVLASDQLAGGRGLSE